MKLRLNIMLVFLAVSLIPAMSKALYQDRLVLVVYEGNAQVNMVLTSANNPDDVIASSVATPISLRTSTGGEDRLTLKNLGHPGTLANRDSEIILFSNALDTLRPEAENALNLGKNEKIELDAVLIGIAGFDYYRKRHINYKDRNTKQEREMTREEYISQATHNLLEEMNFSLISGNKVKVVGDHTLIARASRQRLKEGEAAYENVQLVQLTTCAVGYRVVDGRLIDGSSVSPDEERNGGYYQMGRQLKNKDFSKVPDKCLATATFTDEILQVMNTMSIVKDYEQIPDGRFLAKPKDSIHLYSDPTRKNHQHLFSHWKTPNKFFNEPGYAGIWVMNQAETPTGVTAKSFKAAQKSLKNYMDDIINSVEEVVNKLANDGGREHNEKTIPLVMLGEFPLFEMGFGPALREKLNDLDKPRMKNIPVADLDRVLAKAGLNILEIKQPVKHDEH